MSKTFATVILALFTLTLQAETVKLDDFESGKVKGWHSWPKKGIILSLSDQAKTGKKSLKLDMHEQAGHASKAIPAAFLKANPYGITLWLKAAPGNHKKSFNLMVQENKGQEKYYKAITIPQEWQQVEIKFKDMKLFPYGGAKIKDRKLDPTDIGSIRFESYPEGTVILIDDLTLLTGKKVTQVEHSKKKQAVIAIDEIKLSEQFPDYSKNYPDKVQNVQIDGSSFVRNGQKTFLLGGWQADNEGPPWLFRSLDIDVYPFNGSEIYTLYHPKKNGKKLTLKWKENPWYEALIDRTLKNGIMFWHEHKACARFSALKHYPEFKEIIDSGHFVAYDPFNPIGIRCYDEMHKSWMRYTRKFPIFCYELFNEMGYYNDKKITRDAFKNEMRQKYQSIDKANKIWKTNFKSFTEVQPPGFIASNASSKGVVRDKLRREEGTAHPNLWIDWLKFQEKTCGEAVAYLMKRMRSHDPAPSKLSTLQAHCQLFFDYGETGITPETIDKNTDFYSHEMGQTFFLSNLNENVNNIKKMLKTLLTNDIVRGVSKKPIFNAESPIAVSRTLASEADIKEKKLLNLHGLWKFADGTKALPNNWNQSSFNDTDWANIKVPGMWGKQGFNNCKIGLYRKHFKRPSSTPKSKYYLNGKAFADSSIIYLNGEKIGKTQGYNATFSFDVTKQIKDNNVLAVEITNTYFRDNMYYGGIRGFVTLNSFPGTIKRKLRPTEQHFRSQLWSQVAHGMSGVMVCYDYNLYSSPAKILPRVKKEIESVIDIVMPRPRIKAQAAVIYPKETFRGVLHNGYIQKLSGPATDEFINTYGPMLFSGIGTDVIQNRDICNGKAKNYKMIVMAGNLRGQVGELEKLTDYVKDGGILIADCGSLQVDDDSHQTMSSEKLFGITINSTGNEPIKLSKSTILANNDYTCNKRFTDNVSHEKIKVSTAKTLLSFTDGSPALTVHNLGKGKAYYIAGNLPFLAFNQIFRKICQDNNIKSPITIDKGTPETLFVESNLFTNRNRHVLYLLNWGKDQTASVKINSLPDGNYIIRNLATGNTLKNGKQTVWSNTALQAGIPMTLKSLDTIALLLEKNTETPLVVKNISPTRYKLLDQLWTKPEDNNNQKPLVAFAPIRTMTDNYGDTPTAKRLLELNGFRTENFTPESKLDDVNILVWYNGRKMPKNPQKIIDFVKNGGSLLITGNGIKNYHDAQHGLKPFFKAFDINQTWMKYLSTKNPAKGNDMLNVICKPTSNHSITQYVNEFITASAGEIVYNPKKCSVLLKASENSNSPDAAVMLAQPYGKGKVAFISDYCWLRPLNINKGDNAQLLLNTINWLANKPALKLTDQMRKQALFISDSILAQAEKEEEEGISEFAPFSKRKSTHVDTMGDLAGSAGGDPIVDALQ